MSAIFKDHILKVVNHILLVYGYCVKLLLSVVYILDPSEDEVDVAQEGDLWKLWNSDRGVPLAGIV
jgi:hypothetical protein